VLGHSVDQRSDIFSFGAILYEMLTGMRAFGGESIVELMHAILKDEVPEAEDSGAKIPPALDKLMRRCLEKKPEHRFHSAHDLGFAIDALSMPTSLSGSGMTLAASAAVVGAKASPWRTRVPWAIAAFFLLALVVLSTFYFRKTEVRSETMRFSLAPPEKTSFTEAAAISPDGQQIAFVTISGSGVTSLWVRPNATVTPRQLAGTEGASFPFWSPDSRTLGFFAGGKLRKIEAAGGPIQTIADASVDPRGGAWMADGTIVFSPSTQSPLMRISSSGGAPTPATVLNAEIGQTSHRWPSLMPDGKHFVYFGRGGVTEKQGLYVGSIGSTESKFIIETSTMGGYAETEGKGYLLFVRESTLMAQPFDPARFELSGEAVPLVQGILSFPSEIGPTAFVSFSAVGGRLVYRIGDQQTTRLTWYDRTGKSMGNITDAGGYHEPVISLDGSKVLFGRGGTSNESTTSQDIHVLDLSRGNTTRLTFTTGQEASSVFSPDGGQIVFYSNRDGNNSLYRKSSNGSGSDELLINGTASPYPCSWSRDGKYLLYEMDGGPRTKVDLWILPMVGDRTPILYLQTEFIEAHGQFSPDGRWIAYTSDESGRAEVYIQSFPISGGKWQVSNAGGDQPQWRGDGKELFYLAADRTLMSAAISGTSSLEVGRPESLFQTAVPLTGITDDRNNFSPTQDGQRFVINSLADAENSQPLILVLNWAAELKR